MPTLGCKDGWGKAKADGQWGGDMGDSTPFKLMCNAVVVLTTEHEFPSAYIRQLSAVCLFLRAAEQR
jgi:hypothetical protein